MNDYGAYQFLAVFLVVAVLFALVPLGLARLWAKKFSPQKPGAVDKPDTRPMEVGYNGSVTSHGHHRAGTRHGVAPTGSRGDPSARAAETE